MPRSEARLSIEDAPKNPSFQARFYNVSGVFGGGNGIAMTNNHNIGIDCASDFDNVANLLSAIVKSYSRFCFSKTLRHILRNNAWSGVPCMLWIFCHKLASLFCHAVVGILTMSFVTFVWAIRAQTVSNQRFKFFAAIFFSLGLRKFLTPRRLSEWSFRCSSRVSNAKFEMSSSWWWIS